RWFLGIAQPWGDYLENEDYTYSPLLFADTLLRNSLPISGFELEIVAGDTPSASHQRDRMELYRLLELFQVLGLPLDFLLRHPGQLEKDTENTLRFPTNLWRGSPSAAAQAEWAMSINELLQDSPQVRQVYWGQWADSLQHRNGLITSDGVQKPLFQALLAQVDRNG
ncbi:MAG: hypothetical protein ACRCZF_13210, partial [Gemmataceae bacterium]